MKIIYYKIKNLLKKKPKIVVILGQTATGKSDIAVEIAKKNNGEIISADSRQVYKDMNLGSGKITKEEMQNVKHYLLNVADPKEIFDVKKFQELGDKAIKEILEKNKIPIICGGTGFYINSLVNKTKFSSVKPNLKLRVELEKKSIEELQNILLNKILNIRLIFKLLNKNTYKNIDMQNPIRVIRAIEIIKKIGYIPKTKTYNSYNILYIGLTIPKEELNNRIYKRIINRLKRGMLNEIHTLIESGVSHRRLQSLGLEYRFMSKYILKEITYKEMIEQLYSAIIKFSKRQKTWFKKNKKINWFNPINEKQNIFNTINNFLEK